MAAGKKLTTLEFTERSTTIHEGKFDYSKVEYVNTHTPITIVCPIHGEFQQKPYQHLAGSGCYACSGKQRTSQHDFVERAKQSIGDQYDFVEAVYKNLDTPVVVKCPTHGEFTKTPRIILQQRRGCPDCGNERYIQKVHNSTLTTQEFIKRSNAVHGHNYIYTKVAYEKGSKKVTIVCPKHGDFQQLPHNHLRGQGCPQCSTERCKITCGGTVTGKPPTPSSSNYSAKGREATGKYNHDWFNRFPDDRLQPAQVYCIEVKCDTDHFLKVGITTRTIKKRYQRTGVGETVVDRTVVGCQYMSLYDAFLLERQILRELKEHQYFPNYVLDGYTECFKMSAKDDIIDLLNRSRQDRNI